MTYGFLSEFPMNKKLFAILLCTLSSLISPTQAGIVITGTRVIYPSDKDFVPVQLTNIGEQTALVQSWIDTQDLTADPSTTQAPFIVTPPITKIDANKGQSLRIIFNHKETMANDRESMFWLNVLDIPTKPQQAENYLQFAIRSRLKLFYRPSNINMTQQQAFEKVQIQKINGLLEIDNPTPYYMNCAKLNLILTDGHQNENTSLSFIPPFSKKSISLNNDNSHIKTIKLDLINDFGGLFTLEKNF